MKKILLTIFILLFFVQNALALVAVRVYGNSDWSVKSLDPMFFCSQTVGSGMYFVPTATCKYIPPDMETYYSWSIPNYGCAVAVDVDFNCVTSCLLPTVLDPDTLQCVPPVTCPSSGTKERGVNCSPIEDGNTIGVDGDDDGTHYRDDGCIMEKAITPTDKVRSYLSSDINGNPTACIDVPYTHTGERHLDPIPEKAHTPLDDVPGESPTNDTQDYNNTVSPTSTTNDGAGTETKIDETNEVTNQPTYEKDTETEYVRRDGDLVEKKTTTTTKTNPDGSIEITTDTEYTETDGVEVKVKKETGDISKTSGGTKTTNTTETTTKDGTGAVTGHSKSSTTSGTGTSGTTEENSKGECDTAEENCEDFKEIIGEAPDITEEQGTIDQTISDAIEIIDSQTQSIQDRGSWFEDSGISTVLGDKFNALVPTGSCTDYVINAGGGAYNLTLSCSDSAYVRDVLGYALYVLLALFAFHTLVHPIKG